MNLIKLAAYKKMKSPMMNVEEIAQSTIGAMEFESHTKVPLLGSERNVEFIPKNADYWPLVQILKWMDGPITMQTDGLTGQIGRIVLTLVTIATERKQAVS